MARTRFSGDRLMYQRFEQSNVIPRSLDDETESQIGIEPIERSATQIRKPRSNRARQQRPDHSNVIHHSSNDSAEPQIVQNKSRNTRENVQVSIDITNKENFGNVTTQSNINKKKKTRGPTCMPKIWGLNNHIDVSFNDLGQPNDQKRTSTLAHFLGTLARNGSLCPLNYADWRLMPYSYKEDMLKEVKSRFNIGAGSESFILQSINHKWRNWKSQLKNLKFDPSVSIEEQLLEVPDRVNPDQYKQMLDYWSTNKAQQLSEKKKEARAKLEILHRMGKRSYAVLSEIMCEHMGRHPTRAELFEKCCYPSDDSPMNETVQQAIEKMKELDAQNNENSSDAVVVHKPDDAFAKIMGKDKDGRLRMYGMGVKPNDIYGGRPSRDVLYRKSMEEKEEMKALKQKVEELTALVQTISHPGGISQTQSTQVLSSNNRTSSESISRPVRMRGPWAWNL